jgi:hypothetical protein
LQEDRIWGEPATAGKNVVDLSIPLRTCALLGFLVVFLCFLTFFVANWLIFGLFREMRRYNRCFGRPRKSFGAPKAQISPQQPKFEPLPKRFFSPSHSNDLIYQVHQRINRMNPIF